MITGGAEAFQFRSAPCSAPSGIASRKPKSKQFLLHIFNTKWWRGSRERIGVEDGNLNAATLKLESLINLLRSPVQLQGAIQQLRDLSLVRYESNKDAFVLRIHDLIQTTIQESAWRQDGYNCWFHLAVELVCCAFRKVDDPRSFVCWAQSEMFCPHIQSLAKWDDEHTIGNSQLDEANYGIARYFTSRGRYSEAETLFKQVLAGQNKLLGPNHAATMRTIDCLAAVYDCQGRYDEAETLYGRALAGNERILGSEHLDTLLTVHRLAIAYWRQGRYNEAETLFRREFVCQQRLFGLDHAYILLAIEGLATVSYSQGRYNDAETQYNLVLRGNERIMGSEHPNTMRTSENLANVYYSQGHYVKAETLFKRALAGNEKILGAEHADTLRVIANLAITYNSQGRYGEAEMLYRRALAGQGKVLGPEHPDTLSTVWHFSLFFNEQGRHEEEELLRDEGGCTLRVPHPGWGGRNLWRPEAKKSYPISGGPCMGYRYSINNAIR